MTRTLRPIIAFFTFLLVSASYLSRNVAHARSTESFVWHNTNRQPLLRLHTDGWESMTATATRHRGNSKRQNDPVVLTSGFNEGRLMKLRGGGVGSLLVGTLSILIRNPILLACTYQVFESNKEYMLYVVAGCAHMDAFQWFVVLFSTRRIDIRQAPPTGDSPPQARTTRPAIVLGALFLLHAHRLATKSGIKTRLGMGLVYSCVLGKTMTTHGKQACHNLDVPSKCV